MSTQNVNVARFARNVEWDFFCDFQTLCKGQKFENRRFVKGTKYSKFEYIKKLKFHAKNWREKGWRTNRRIIPFTILTSTKSRLGWREKSLDKLTSSWANTLFSKSSFFVQKFNFDFPNKLSIFWGEKLVKMLWFWTFLAVDNFDFTRKIVQKIWVENSWKCWGFVKIEFLDKNLTFRIVC